MPLPGADEFLIFFESCRNKEMQKIYVSDVGVLRSYDSLKCLCSEMNLRRPEQVSSVNLRKYTTIISQVKFKKDSLFN